MFGNSVIYNSITTPTIWEPTVTSTDILEIKDRLKAIEERLLILYPNKVLLDKHESLRNAYEHYKLIERLLENENEKE